MAGKLVNFVKKDEETLVENNVLVLRDPFGHLSADNGLSVLV
jgi:hypothetical protein